MPSTMYLHITDLMAKMIFFSWRLSADSIFLWTFLWRQWINNIVNIVSALNNIIILPLRSKWNAVGGKKTLGGFNLDHMKFSFQICFAHRKWQQITHNNSSPLLQLLRTSHRLSLASSGLKIALCKDWKASNYYDTVTGSNLPILQPS